MNKLFQLLGAAISPSLDDLKAQAQSAEDALIAAFSVLAGELLVVIFLLILLIVSVRKAAK